MESLSRYMQPGEALDAARKVAQVEELQNWSRQTPVMEPEEEQGYQVGRERIIQIAEKSQDGDEAAEMIRHLLEKTPSAQNDRDRGRLRAFNDALNTLTGNEYAGTPMGMGSPPAAQDTKVDQGNDNTQMGPSGVGDHREMKNVAPMDYVGPMRTSALPPERLQELGYNYATGGQIDPFEFLEEEERNPFWEGFYRGVQEKRNTTMGSFWKRASDQDEIIIYRGLYFSLDHPIQSVAEIPLRREDIGVYWTPDRTSAEGFAFTQYSEGTYQNGKLTPPEGQYVYSVILSAFVDPMNIEFDSSSIPTYTDMYEYFGGRPTQEQKEQFALDNGFNSYQELSATDQFQWEGESEVTIRKGAEITLAEIEVYDITTWDPETGKAELLFSEEIYDTVTASMMNSFWKDAGGDINDYIGKGKRVPDYKPPRPGGSVRGIGVGDEVVSTYGGRYGNSGIVQKIDYETNTAIVGVEGMGNETVPLDGLVVINKGRDSGERDMESLDTLREFDYGRLYASRKKRALRFWKGAIDDAEFGAMWGEDKGGSFQRGDIVEIRTGYGGTRTGEVIGPNMYGGQETGLYDVILHSSKGTGVYAPSQMTLIDHNDGTLYYFDRGTYVQLTKVPGNLEGATGARVGARGIISGEDRWQPGNYEVDLLDAPAAYSIPGSCLEEIPDPEIPNPLGDDDPGFTPYPKNSRQLSAFRRRPLKDIFWSNSKQAGPVDWMMRHTDRRGMAEGSIYIAPAYVGNGYLGTKSYESYTPEDINRALDPTYGIYQITVEGDIPLQEGLANREVALEYAQKFYSPDGTVYEMKNPIANFNLFEKISSFWKEAQPNQNSFFDDHPVTPPQDETLHTSPLGVEDSIHPPGPASPGVGPGGTLQEPVSDPIDNFYRSQEGYEPDTYQPPDVDRIWHPDLSAYTYVDEAGGSTGAQIVADPDGLQYAMKRGADPGHLMEESYADDVYRAAGLNVPPSNVYRDENGDPAKVSQWIYGRSLRELMHRGDPGADQVIQDLKDGYAVDALIGNWDVVGLDFDNVKLGDDGITYRIDNGGSFRRRAQGDPKPSGAWSCEVTEIYTLRDSDRNHSAGSVFGDLDDQEIASQIARHILPNRNKILAVIPEDLQEMINCRIDYMAQWAGLDPYSYQMGTTGSFWS